MTNLLQLVKELCLLFLGLMTLLNNYFSQICLVPFNPNKNLKELLESSKYPSPKNKCVICKNSMVFNRTFKCTVTYKVYFIFHKVYFIFQGKMNCESTSIISLKTWIKCLEEYFSSAIKFKSTFSIHNSHIKTTKIIVGLLGTLVSNKCCRSYIVFYICVYSSLGKYTAFMMTVILKIVHWTEKNIGNFNYLEMQRYEQ